MNHDNFDLLELDIYLGTEVGVLGLFAQLESDDESVDEVKELSLIPLSLREGERELSSSLRR